MPEVKLNSRNPFYLRFTHPDFDAVVLNIYIYSGTKNTDKGSPKFQLYKDKTPGTNEVVFEIADLIKDYLTPKIDTPLNSNIDYVKWVQIESKVISDKPQAEDITVITERNVGKNITLTGTDRAFRPLTYAIASGPSSGTATLSGRTVGYRPNQNFSGTDTFTYTVNNGIQDSDAATVTVEVKTADNGWFSTEETHYGTTLSNARQNLINNVNPVSDILPINKQYYHLGYTAYAPYNLTQTGLIDIGRSHWQEVNRTNPIPDGYYAQRYWTDYETNPDHQQIATWQVTNGLVSKAFIYSE